jgi:hypothetical protein
MEVWWRKWKFGGGNGSLVSGRKYLIVERCLISLLISRTDLSNESLSLVK